MTTLFGVGGTAFYAGHGIKQDTHANAVANQWTLCNSSGSYYYDWVWAGGYSNAWSFTINNNVVTDLATDTPHGFVASSSTTPPANGANSSTDYPATGTATISATNKYLHIFDSVNDQKFYVDVSSLVVSGPTVNYGPSHGALPTSTGFTVYNLNFTKVGDREYKISYQQKNAPNYSYTVRISHTISNGSYQDTDYTVTTAASGQTINLKSGSLYGTGPQAATTTPQNNSNLTIRFMDFNAKLGSTGPTIGQGLIFNTWTYLYNNLNATFTPSSGVPGTIFNFTLTGSDDSYASSNTATLTDPSGTVTTFTKNAEGQFHDSVTNVTSIEGNYTVEHPAGVNRGTSTYDNSAPPVVVTTSNGGGKPDRYPLIMTNLFNRNRSIYSIGMTHKDTWDLFL